jgi:Protein kinase domain
VAEDVLARAVDGVADGAVVNWGALHGLARSDDERAELKWLQVLGDLANLHRSSHNEEADEDSSERTHAVPAGAQTVGLESWGRYRLVRRLGAGSFGSVYCAWDPQLERNIAIKILHEHVADDRLKHRLLREGRALARVQHSNVVQVFGTEAHGSRVGLCMEFVEGETLAGGLRSRGLMSHGEAAVVGQDVCRALAAVHAAGYVHRDVKAQNVMRNKAGKIVLMDFGTGHNSSGNRRAGDLVGTPVYMAPEVLLDGQPASVQSDIYAVGVLLYLLVSGQYPVEGSNLIDLIDAHKAGRRRPLLERRPDLPMSFVSVVSRALAANPAERWPSAAAMLEALEGAKPADSHAFEWVQTITRVLAVIVGGLAGLTFLGMVSSRYFNVALGREAFVAEGVGDWLYWGAVSMVAPTVLVLMVLVGLSLLRLAFRLLLLLWPRGRGMVDALPATMRRLGLDDVDALSAGALVLSVAVLAAVWWYLWAEIVLLLELIDPNVATAPAESLAFLSPSFESRHTDYRYTLEWACIILVALWWVPFRMAARRAQRLNPGVLAAAGAALLLALLLLHFPYRLLYQAELEAVEWDGRRCFVLGERNDEELLFCPDLEPPRNRAVSKGTVGLKHLGTRMNPFGDASVSPVERP